MRDDVMTMPQDRNAVAWMGVDERASFIARTYSHLFGAIVAFVLFELLLFRTPLPEKMLGTLSGGGGTWLLYLGGFMVVGWVATRAAHTVQSPALQYAALFGYVLAQALLFMPLLLIANEYAPGAISSAALVTLLAFSCLTAIVFVTRKDFSFLRTVLLYGGFLALGLIVASIAFGFNLGLVFSFAMVAFAGAAVLYDTSNVLHHYPADRHVGAALGLFASIALMFWYVLRIFIAMRD